MFGGAPFSEKTESCPCVVMYFMTLSPVAGKPKKQGALISLCIMLGPDFISDTIVVETSDHARLKVAISMNNVFRVCVIYHPTVQSCVCMCVGLIMCICTLLITIMISVSLLCVQVERGNAESEAKLFSVPDFIGFAGREVASKIRASVASLPFEQFHKYSNDIIRAGVFGKDEEGQLREELVFKANNLVRSQLIVALYLNPPG